MDVAGGTKYNFFVDGLFYSPINGHYYTANLHASNAALSDATEEGADGIFHCLDIPNGGETRSSIISPHQDLLSDSGVDSGVDGNIQVFGELAVIPLPSTMLLLSSGLLGLWGWRMWGKC